MKSCVHELYFSVNMWYIRLLKDVEALYYENCLNRLGLFACFSTAKLSSVQVWYHRRAIVELSGDSSGEMALTREVLVDDAKNYHAWASDPSLIQNSTHFLA